MRKYIFISLLLLVVGIAASLAMIPDARELAGLQAKDAQSVDLGNVDVEAEYAQGRRTFPIISGLADKRVAAGDRPGAVKVLEEYVAANAADVNGHKKLAEQYQLSGNNKGYNEQLEKIAAAAPTEANLRLLSDIYNASKEYGKQVDVLKKMLEVTKGTNPQIFVDLATIQVVTGDTAGALATVEALSVKHPKFSSYPMTRIMVSVLADKGETDKAFAAAKAWMDTPSAPVPAPAAPAAAPLPPTNNAAIAASSRPQELADLCNILHYSGRADRAVALVDLYVEMLKEEPTLVLAYINANITAGRADHAYTTLKVIDESGHMVAALYPPYLDLALKRDDVAAAEAIAKKLDAPNFTEELALNTLEIARSHNAPSVMAILTTRFGEPLMLKEKPVLAAVIGVLTNAKTQDATIDVALKATLTSTQRLSLAETCARAKKTACFDTIVKQYPPHDQMSPTQVAEYAQLFIIADRASEQLAPVGKLATAPNAPSIVQIAYRRLAAASGRLDILKPWLEANSKTAPAAQLQELFYLANDRKHGELASDIAERLFARDPSPMNRDIMVAAYLGAGKNEKAVVLLRDQVKDMGVNDGVYLATLSKLAPKNAAFRKEQADYAQGALQSGRGDARQQLNYAYILLNNGHREAVLPYAKNFAATRGGEWKKLYAQLSTKQKAGGAVASASKLSREQLLAQASASGASPAKKREVAFALLNGGHKDDALKLFTALAADKGPTSQEVKDLLFLWGGKLNAEQLAWVSARAKTATPADKQGWAELVNNTADTRGVLTYVGATSDALYNAKLRKRYFGVLADTGSRSNYETAMHDWVAKTTDVPALMDYATIAKDYGYREAAINGYGRVLALDPNNNKALSQKATLDFSKGKFAEADAGLNHYLADQSRKPAASTKESTSDTAQAHFYKAQLLRRAGNKAAAAAEFAQVVNLTMQNGAATPDALSRLHTAQFHLGQQREAKAGFTQLLQQFPNDKGVLADYMSVLIEYNDLDEATRVANQYDKSSPYYRKGAALVGRTAPVVAAQQVSEVVVRVAGKPAYLVRYTPTANEQIVLAAAGTPSPQAEAKRQQDLRLQLLYARIEQQSGQVDKARMRLDALKRYYPNDPQLLSYEASLESASGNRSKALALVQEAQKTAPENEELSLQAQNIRQVNRGGSYVKLDHEYRALGSNNEQITTLSSNVRAGDRAEVGIVAQNNMMQTDQTRRGHDGAIGNYDTDRQRGEVYAAYNFEDSTRVQGSVFANNETAGGGAYVETNSAIGRLQVLGEYHRPYWDFIEAVYEDATRDRVGFKDFATLRPTTTLGLEASYNNYNTSEMDDVAQTVLLRANIVQELQPQTASQPFLGLGYGFDGEYITGGKPESRLDALNRSYYLLPVRTREVHALTGIYRDDLTAQTHALLIGGMAYDRINGGLSPLVEGRIDHDLSAAWQVGGRARYAQETNNTDNHELNLGADVLYKF